MGHVENSHSKKDISIPEKTSSTVSNEQLMELQRELEEKTSLIQSLTLSSKQYKDLLDHSPDSVVILQEGVYRYASSSFFETFGYSQKEIDEGLSFMELVQERDKNDVLQRYQERIQGEDLPSTYRLDLQTKDGSIIPVETSATLITYKGSPADLVIMRDISDRIERLAEIQNLKELSEILISTSHEAISVTDLEGKVIFISSLTLKIHGFEHAQDMVGMNALDLISPEDHEKAKENMTRTLEIGSIRGVEYTMLRRDGSSFIGELNATLIRNVDRHPVGFIATVRDISSRKSAQLELIRREDQYRSLAESIQEGIYTLDSEGRYTYVNDVVVQRSGYPREWWIDRAYTDALPPDQIPEIRKLFEATIEENRSQRAEFRYDSKVGKILWLEVTTTPLHQGGKVSGLMGLSRDITERKKTEILQQVMFDITNTTNTPYNSTNLYQSIQSNLGKIIDTTNFYIALYDNEKDIISLPFFIDEKDDFIDVPAGKTFTSHVIRSNKPMLLREEDIERLVSSGEIEEIGTRPKIWLGVPFKDGEKVIGAIVVQSYNNDSLYTEDDFEVMKFISENIAFSIKRQQTDVALRANEEKYRALFQNSNDAIFIHDLDQKILDANQKALDLMGYSIEEILEMKVSQLHPRGLLDSSSHAFKEVRDSGQINIQIDFLKKSGEVFTASLSSSIYEIGDQVLVQGIVRDVTQRVKAEKALMESEAKFRSVSERSPNMIFINKDGRIVYVNEKCTEIMGYSREEFYSPKFDFWSLIHKDSISIIQEQMNRHRQGLDVTPYEYQIVTKDGVILDTINNSRIIEYQGDLAILGIITDVTEIKRTEEKLRRTEEQFRKVFESTKEGIIVSDGGGVIISANPGASSMLGYDGPGELVGKPEIDIFLKPEKRQSLINDLQDKENLQDIELRFRTKDERIIYVLSTASCHMNDAGELLNTQIIFMDITERKQAEEEMKRRLMKFRLESGNIYLVKESSPTLSLEAFKDLLNVGYHGTVISRTPRQDLAKTIGEEFKYYWLAEKETDDSIKPTINEISRKFEDLGRQHVVFLDRLDYIISKNNFKKTLSLVHHLRELILLKGAIVILSLDQFILKPEQLRLFEKECKDVEPLHKKIISDDLFSILKYVYRQNTLGIKPSYSSVGKELNISKPTVRKRIGDLISTGYLREDTKGRNKAIELTERSRQLFWK